ncbi:MAG: hypothetical protein HY897_13970 [Deltaproteobacteria bacterium]|nr:hypothetical protein [Deltaproteobacteria bacterium]
MMMPPIHDARAQRLAPVFLALVAACSTAAESVSDYEVTVGVKRYNEALATAYARESAEPLAGAATAAEMQRVDDIVNFLGQGGMTMDARQESFDAQKVSVSADGRATLNSDEVWWYRHWNPATGEVKQAPRRVRYQMHYTLVKDAGRWLVDRLEETGYKELAVRADSK